MSVANILITEDRVFCLTDTLVYQIDDGKGRPVALCDRKCGTFPGGFAMATRGNVYAGDRCAEAIADVEDFDAAEAALMNFLPAWEVARATAFPGGNVEAFLIGWSAKHGGPRVVLAVLPKSGEKFVVKVLPAGLHLAPGYSGAVLPVPKPGTPADKIAAGMVKIATAQFAVREERFQEMCIGGVMHLTTAGREGAEQRVVGLYSNYDSLVEVFGDDPNADAVAEFRRDRARAVA